MSRLTLEFMRGWLYIGLVLATLALLLWWPQVQDWLDQRNLLPEKGLSHTPATTDQQPPTAEPSAVDPIQGDQQDPVGAAPPTADKPAETVSTDSQTARETSIIKKPATTESTNEDVANEDNSLNQGTTDSSDDVHTATLPPTATSAEPNTDQADPPTIDTQTEETAATASQGQPSADVSTEDLLATKPDTESVTSPVSTEMASTDTTPDADSQQTIATTNDTNAIHRPPPSNQTHQPAVGDTDDDSVVQANDEVSTTTPMTSALTQAAQEIPKALLADQALQAQPHPERPFTWILSADQTYQIHALSAGTIVANYENPFHGGAIYLFDQTRGLLFLYSQLDTTTSIEKDQSVDAFAPLGRPTKNGNRFQFHLAIHRIEPDQKWWQGTAIDPADILAQ